MMLGVETTLEVTDERLSANYASRREMTDSVVQSLLIIGTFGTVSLKVVHELGLVAQRAPTDYTAVAQLYFAMLL